METNSKAVNLSSGVMQMAATCARQCNASVIRPFAFRHLGGNPRRIYVAETACCILGRVVGPRLSVVMPVYNELPTMPEVLNRVLDVPIEKEVLIVDDGSTDGSAERGQDIARNEKAIRWLSNERHGGKGLALRTGFASATGEYVVVQDADLEYDPSEIPKLLDPLIAGHADAVYGSRFLVGDARKALSVQQYLANRLLTGLCNRLTGLRLTDMETCYKAIRRDLLQSIPLQEDGFGCEPEITCKLAQVGARVVEVSVSYAGRGYREGKKIRAWDGLRAVFCIVKYSRNLRLRRGQGRR